MHVESLKNCDFFFNVNLISNANLNDITLLPSLTFL